MQVTFSLFLVYILVGYVVISTLMLVGAKVYQGFGGSLGEEENPFLWLLFIQVVALGWLCVNLYKLIHWAIQYPITKRRNRIMAQLYATELHLERQRVTEIRSVGSQIRQQMQQLFNHHVVKMHAPNSITVVDPTPPVAYKATPSTPLATELRQMKATADFQQVPEKVKCHYKWHRLENKRKAIKHAEALVLADQMSLFHQVTLHKQALVYWLSADMAERAYVLARWRLGYRGEIAHREYSIVAGQTFREFVSRDSTREVTWVFSPIEQFGKRIPLHALQAIKRLAADGLTPEAYWVADKLETVIPRPTYEPISPYSRSIDPILCAQYGTFLTGVAMWL